MIDLAPKYMDTVKKILRAKAPGFKALVFGSRVKGVAKEYSDLDLAIEGSRALSPLEIYDLKEAFDDSELPFRVDVVDWHFLSDDFKNEIEKHHEVLIQP